MPVFTVCAAFGTVRYPAGHGYVEQEAWQHVAAPFVLATLAALATMRVLGGQGKMLQAGMQQAVVVWAMTALLAEFWMKLEGQL